MIGSTGRGDYGHGLDVAAAGMPNVRIVGVADTDDRGRQQAQQRLNAPQAWSDYRRMLSEVSADVVVICPRWIDQHRDMILAAAEAGCHVYMEKPFCRTPAECDEVIRALEMRHLQLAIAHVTQYSPVLDRVQSLIRAGEIGELLEIRGRGKEDHRGGGEDLWVLGSHILMLTQSLVGARATTCSAIVRHQGRPVTRNDVVNGPEGLGLIAGDHLMARYEFPGQVTGDFASRRNAGAPPGRFAVQVFGSRGIIEIPTGYLQPAWILRDGSWSPGRSGRHWEPISSAGIGKPEPRRDTGYRSGHVAAMTDLFAAAEQGRAPRCSAEDARAVVEMTAAVFESHRLRRPVSLPLEIRGNPLTLL